jgi:hypothetical protein
MEEPHDEGVATHVDPESCSDGREAAAEALTGARSGRVWSREISPPGCRRCPERRKATRPAPPSRGADRPCAVIDPEHVRNLAAREPGDPHAAGG